MKLNKTPNPLNREARNKENENWDKIERNFNNVVEEVSDRAFDKVIDGSKIDWSQMVNSVDELPTDAGEGETRGVKSDNKIYRFNGADWVPIAEINLNPIAEVDQRLTTQLAETDHYLGIKGSKVDPIETGVVTFVTDDGSREDYDVFKDIFASAGVPCCTAVIPSYVEGNPSFAKKEELLELQNNYGWEILSHSNSNDPLTSLTENDLDDQLRTSKEWLINNGFDVESFSIPHGRYDARVKSFIKKYYKAARSSAFGSKGYNELPLDTYSLNSCWFDTNVNSPHYEGFTIRTFDYYKNLIDQAMQKKKWLIISFHSFDYQNWSASEKTTFNQIVNYAANNSNVMRFTEAYDQFANVIDVGYGSFDNLSDNRFSIGRDGSVKTEFKVDSKKYNGKSGFREFEDITTTLSVIDDPDEDMPTTERGILLTHRYGHEEPEIYTTQFYYSTDDSSQRVWKRNLAIDGTWRRWIPITFYQYAIKARYDYGFSPNTPIDDFPIGVTENHIDNTHESLDNQPFGAGVLITHKFDDAEKGYNFQVFHPYGQEVIYKRAFQTNGTPRTWRKYEPNNFRMLDSNETTPDTPITEFPLGVTRNVVQGGDLPGGAPTGILTTNKNHPTEHVFNNQEFQTSDLKLYKRRFSALGGVRSWELVSEPIS